MLVAIFSLIFSPAVKALTCFDSNSPFPETTQVCKTGQVCYSEYYALKGKSGSVVQHFDRFCVYAEDCEYRGIRLPPPTTVAQNPTTRAVEWIETTTTSRLHTQSHHLRPHYKHKTTTKGDASNRVQLYSSTHPYQSSAGCRSLASLDISIQQTFLKAKKLQHINDSILHTRFCCCATNFCNDADASSMSSLFNVVTQVPPNAKSATSPLMFHVSTVIMVVVRLLF